MNEQNTIAFLIEQLLTKVFQLVVIMVAVVINYICREFSLLDIFRKYIHQKEKLMVYFHSLPTHSNIFIVVI